MLKDKLSINIKVKKIALCSPELTAENFGKAGINFFLNLEGLNAEDVAEMFDMEELKIFLKVAKFISFEYSNDGGKLIITAKDGKENVLKQALTEIMKEFSGKMGNNFIL